ncbi:TRAP transporter large permease subunit [Roseovarius pacificus]|uniref:TRAP transporter large permease n=1 Tax=Roseovarius pacificus TaxID=337701 RepID=UPI002A18E2D1|nr:TRAP transporter large permease subunit [Roseovarius pacificus]
MSAALSTLAAFLVAGAPVAFSLIAAGAIYLVWSGAPLSTLSSHLFASLDSAAIMTIPFFVLAAEILARSGATRDMVALVARTAGGNRGNLPIVAVLSCAFFGAICGSSTATAAAIGVVLIPEMVKQGYDKRFCVGLVATAGGLGMLIPPSIPLIVYGVVTDTSIGDLFAAAIVPGLLLTTLLCLAAYVVGRRVPVQDDISEPSFDGASPRRGLFLVVMPVLVLGGIYTGLFTPTEAASVSVLYALLLAFVVYRMPIEQFAQILGSAAATTSIILLIMAGAALVGYAVTAERAPHAVFMWIKEANVDRATLMLILAGCFLIAGMLLEVLSIILIAMPILIPVLVGADIDLVAFGVLLIVNMELAVITPPIGLNLFVISSISKMRVQEVFAGTLPFALTLMVALLGMIGWVLL